MFKKGKKLSSKTITHNFNGINTGGKIIVNGTYDINIWYSYDNNTKTNVIVQKFNYQDIMNVKLKENGELNTTSEIIVRSLNQPSVTDVNVENSNIKLNVHKEMGVEVVGDTKVKVSVEEDEDDYEEILDEEAFNSIKDDELRDNNNIEEDYLN